LLEDISCLVSHAELPGSNRLDSYERLVGANLQQVRDHPGHVGRIPNLIDDWVLDNKKKMTCRCTSYMEYGNHRSNLEFFRRGRDDVSQDISCLVSHAELPGSNCRCTSYMEYGGI
jgi:aerobic-type carbon monoxide dehydrogenase small subunit (CoxS/CutS family)